MKDEIFEILERLALLFGVAVLFAWGFTKLVQFGTLQGNIQTNMLVTVGAICFVLYYFLASFMFKGHKPAAPVKNESAEENKLGVQDATDGPDDVLETEVDALPSDNDDNEDVASDDYQMPNNITFLKQKGNVKKGDAILVLKTQNDGAPFVHTIKDPLGIHARPAGSIGQLVKGLNCKVVIKCGDKSASASSIIELMKLGATKGSKLEVSAEGQDAAKALKALKSFMDAKL